ncbi:MAG: tetratricopeptide repeat protein [Candidatus Lambdaproteobacteria bacterium]|nr:tetratricopeptide repeat protein [Candidatus Lambdaproteobacteria bacterium]
MTLRAVIALSLAGGLVAGFAPVRQAAAQVEDALRAYRSQLGSADEDLRHSALLWLGQHGDERAVQDILSVLQHSDELSRRLAERALWSIWSRSGDDEVDQMLAMGSGMLATGRLSTSIDVFNEIIRRRPDFAEGYNKRATAWYYMGEYERSMEDIVRTLQRNPNHFGALSGAGLCLTALERPEQALHYIKRALSINPNMASMRDLAHDLEASLSKRMM